MIFLFNLLFYLSVCSFFLYYSYYLKSLMMMEFVVVSVMLILLGSIYGCCDYIIYFMILGVCEGTLGLLMVVFIYRSWGNDSFMLVDFDF